MCSLETSSWTAVLTHEGREFIVGLDYTSLEEQILPVVFSVILYAVTT